MISDLDETLKQLLIQKTPLDPAQVDINFDIPDREWSTGLAKPAINLYLYDIRENRELRETDWEVSSDEQSVHRHRVPKRIDLAYLITAWTRAVEDEHHLLWQALATFFRHPELPPEMLQGALKQQGRPVRLVTAQGDGVLKNPADFWAALDNQLKPSVNVVATVELDLQWITSAPPVSKVLIGTVGMGRDGKGSARERQGAAPERAPDEQREGLGVRVEEVDRPVRPIRSGR